MFTKRQSNHIITTKFENYEEEDKIDYKQWLATDRTQMVTQISTIDVFVYDLTKK